MKNICISVPDEQDEWLDKQKEGNPPTSKSRVVQNLIGDKMEAMDGE